MSRRSKVDPEDLVTVAFDDLVIGLREFGLHRGRDAGFGEVFGFSSLRGRRFTKIAKRVKKAYEGKKVPDHWGWPDQRDALKWLVDKGTDAMYAFKDDIRVRRGHDDTYYILGGHHRLLALYILGAESARVAVERW